MAQAQGTHLSRNRVAEGSVLITDKQDLWSCSVCNGVFNASYDEAGR